ncbi:MAG: hypothetical protein AB7R69_02255 [Candidatus Babeliales bacterium]
MKKIFYSAVWLIVFCGFYSDMHSSGVLLPDSLRVGHCAFTSPVTSFIGAGKPGAGAYTLSRFDSRILTPLAQEKVTLNQVEDQQNPFYDEAIIHLKAFYTNPLLVYANKPHDIYYVTNFATDKNPMGVMAACNIADAQGNTTAGIAALTVYQTVQEKDIENRNSYIIAAVKSAEGSMAQPGAGLALLKFHAGKLNCFDAVTGTADGNKAFPFDIDPAAQELVQINGGLDSIGDVVDFCWDDNFERFYVALQIKTKDDAASHQGACALLVGRVWEDKIYLDPIVPGTVFSADKNNIVGAVGQGRYVSLHKLTTMHTSCGLPYLVVVGGNGKPEETASSVYAFPLTNRVDKNFGMRSRFQDAAHGALAKRKSAARALFLPGRFGRFKGRVIDEQATKQEDFYSADQKEVIVGGGALLPNKITHVMAVRDCVIVMVQEDGNGQEAGVFSSQALYDEHGFIAAWSPWKRISGSSSHPLDFIIEPHRFVVNIIESENSVLSLKSADWRYTPSMELINKEELLLHELLQKEFPPEVGGIQGLFDFDTVTRGVSGQQKSSCMIATGNNKVVWVQTSTEGADGIVHAYKKFSSLAHATNASLEHDFPETMQAISFSGGALQELGPITSACFVHTQNQTYLLVGGVDGLALLTDAYGNGWSTHEGLGKSFSNLPHALSFKKIGDYQFVQKLIFYNGHLYILTDSRLDCVPWTTDVAAGTAWPARTLLSHKELQATFKDVLISHACIMLATGKGLFVGAEDIAENPGALRWHTIALPGSSVAALKLYAVTHSGEQADFINEGQIFVLLGSVSQAEAELYRLSISNGKISLVEDFDFKGDIARFISFGGFRDNFATDGLVFISTRSAGSPMAHVLPTFVAGKLVASSKGYIVPIDAPRIFDIRQIARNSATGSWLVGGDFGVCMHE